MKHKSKDIAIINKDLARTRRAIVGLGCSYVWGKGAYDLELLQEEKPLAPGAWGDWDYRDRGHEQATLKRLGEKFNLPFYQDRNTLDTALMENQNSFVTQLAEVELNNTYTPINLGEPGNGNLSAIDRLFIYDIDWHLADEIIVVFMATDLLRTDLVSSHLQEFSKIGQDYRAIFPTDKTKDELVTPTDYLEYGYTQTTIETSYEYRFLLRNYKVLSKWCNMYNAKLLIFPAFRALPTFDEMIQDFAGRTPDGVDLDNLTDGQLDAFRYIKAAPHNNVINIQNHKSFGDWLLTLDGVDASKYDILDIVHNKKIAIDHNYLTPCGHPSKIAHAMLATELATVFKDRNWI